MAKGDWIVFNNLIINPDNIVKIHKSESKVRIEFTNDRFIDFEGGEPVDAIWEHFLEFCGDKFETPKGLEFEPTSR